MTEPTPWTASDDLMMSYPFMLKDIENISYKNNKYQSTAKINFTIQTKMAMCNRAITICITNYGQQIHFSYTSLKIHSVT